MGQTHYGLEQHVRLPMGDLRLLELHYQVRLLVTSQSLISWKYFSRENGQRAIGCPGLDTPFEEWPFRNYNSPIYASEAMDCTKNNYQGLSSIVESFANDQQYWSGEIWLSLWDTPNFDWLLLQ